MMRILPAVTQIDFLGRRVSALIFSSVLIVASIAALASRGLMLGIDFTGGTLAEVSYAETADVSSARVLLKEAGFDDAVVQYFGTAKDILVRIPARADKNSAALSDEIMTALRRPYGERLAADQLEQDRQTCVRDGQTTACQVQMRRVEFVGPQVGRELTEQGGLAVLYALIGILIYVGFRFEWRFALGAIAALVHDVLITIGIFSIVGMDFSLTVLAALLAVIGYSLNDTIVVFDRIRENFRKMRKGATLEIMNRSINQTLPRTILTSTTTLVVLLALFFLGGEIIRGFALALIIGVLVGTYSSVFVAAPLVSYLGLTREDLLVPKKEGAAVDRLP